MRAWWLAVLAGAAVAGWLWYKNHLANGTVNARVWRPSAPGFVYPEMAEDTDLAAYLRGKENFGIALAGGGGRGYAMALGAVRSLRKAGVLQRARYLSTSSGSVWFGAALYYRDQAKDKMDDFLGVSLPPEELTPENVTSAATGTAITKLEGLYYKRYPKGFRPGAADEAKKAFARRLGGAGNRTNRRPTTLSDIEASRGLPSGTLDKLLSCNWREDPCSCLAFATLPHTSLEELWGFISSYIYLRPFGLAAPYSSLCHEADRERVEGELGKLGWGLDKKLYTSKDMSQGLPFHVSQTAIIAPFSTEKGSDSNFVVWPIEHTALYTGTAASFAGTSADSFGGIGDVLVDSFAWPGAAVEPVPNTSSAEIKVRRYVTTLNTGQVSEVAGVATAYIADFMAEYRLPRCEIVPIERLLPHAKVWSPLNVDSRGVPRTQLAAVGDAGAYDDLGHLPLLRRRVPKMVIFDSSAVHDNSTGTDKENLCQMTYTLAAFGQPGCLTPGNPEGSPTLFMEANFSTVFKPSEFDALWKRIVELHAAEEPIVVRGIFTVVDNAHLGIVGGWRVEILWVIATPVAAWRNRLPRRTSELLPSFFPNYLAADMRSTLEVSATSQFTSWITENLVLKEIRSMLGDETVAGRVVTV